MEGLCNSHILNHSIWKEKLSTKIGNTLGKEKNDCDKLSIVENNGAYTTSDVKLYDSTQKQEDFAKEIDNVIIKTTWEIVSNKITKQIAESTSSNLRNALKRDGKYGVLNWEMISMSRERFLK